MAVRQISAPRISARAKNTILAILAFVVIGVIIWLDINTGIWNNLVILSGLAAGLVTFLLTALVLDRILARATERKWAPVSRLALTEFLHSIADEDRSEISRGVVVTRLLTAVNAGADRAETLESLHQLRQTIVEERSKLAITLSHWAEFLSSSGANEDVLRHVAEITSRLDTVRDSTLEAEADSSQLDLGAVNAEVEQFNRSMRSLEVELRARIAEEARLAAQLE